MKSVCRDHSIVIVEQKRKKKFKIFISCSIFTRFDTQFAPTASKSMIDTILLWNRELEKNEVVSLRIKFEIASVRVRLLQKIRN